MTDDELRDEIPEGTGGSEQITEKNYPVCGAKKRQGVIRGRDYRYTP